MTQPWRALIADDEQAPREQLALALARLAPDFEIVARCVHGVDAWDEALAHEPDVCFLDIRMPGLDGLEVARRLAALAQPPQVVMVTAYSDHALSAFEAGAIDYLLKPLEDARLSQTLERLRARRLAGQGSRPLGQGQPVMPLPSPEVWAQVMAQVLSSQRIGYGDGHGLGQGMAQGMAQRMIGQGMEPGAPLALGRSGVQLHTQRPRVARPIQASVGKEVRLIAPDDVIFFESDSRYTRVVHTEGEALIRTPLKELLAQLDPDQFWQVHRSVVVQQRFIASALRVDESTMVLTLKGRTERLPVSRQFQGLFKGQ
jgi:DNA-binding LytR/AlgR family response regulator